MLIQVKVMDKTNYILRYANYGKDHNNFSTMSEWIEIQLKDKKVHHITITKHRG